MSQNLGQEKQQPQKKISYSELKIWNECPYKHKLIYKDKIKKFEGNEYTAFGSALHYICESLVYKKSIDTDSVLLEFDVKFLEELKSLPEHHELNSKLVRDMRSQVRNMVDHIIPGLNNYFGEYEIISVEEPLFESMESLENDYNFKGFIDLVLKTSDGKYHILDWKTCSWGWDMKRKTDKITTYQLTLYKKFYSLKYNVDMDNIETHFGLLKRTAKSKNVEIFRVSSGERKTNNALKLLNDAIYNIKSGLSIKNRSACKNCEFYKTKHCR